MDSKWLRDAIHFSLKASHSTTNATGAPTRDPKLRKLVEGLLYSRSFILTYHLAILGCILLLTAVHWVQICLRWRRRRSLTLDDIFINERIAINSKSVTWYHNQRDPPGVCSSGSSTIEGTASPPRKDCDENEDTPLLHNGISQPPQTRKPIWSMVKAFLIYQPPPIPVVNRTLPSNGMSIVVLAFLALNFFYMFFHINFNALEFFVLADRFGLVFVANLPLLYLLAAKNQPLKLLTGRSYESLNIFHRRLGELLCLQAFLHLAGMVYVWYILLRPSGLGLIRFLLSKVILLGLGAFLCYEILYFTSLGSFRQRWYELFLGMHVIFQVSALIFLFFHHSTAKPYVKVAIVIFLVDRIVYRIWRKSETFKAQVEVLEDRETVMLSSTLHRNAVSRISTIVGTSISAGWTATDHVFITIPSLARKHLVQAHPFTIASAAPAENFEDLKLQLIIRAQDGFSRDLLKTAQVQRQLMVRVDGPYGSSRARDMLDDSDLALIVAGGSGIAVGWPLVQYLLNSTRSSDTETASIPPLGRQKIILIWVIHKGSHLSWIGRQAFADAEYRGAEIIVPRATEEIGRPDLNGMIRDLVSTHAGGHEQRTRVVASGPDGMGRLVKNTCADLILQGKDVNVAFEKFGW